MNEEQASVTLTINGQKVTVPRGTTVYNAAQKIGVGIPIFCYHDRMPPFGACRVCLVQVEKMNKLQTSCTLEATEGMVVHTESNLAVEGRKGIMELLLINHPLDCPICDRGGECPLQENTIKYGPGKSRFFEDKRRFEKPLFLNSVLALDRERCIVCARCTRFGEHVAGDSALVFKERGFKTEVGTPKGKEAESKFIGNTIMICPVGALTSAVYRFRARPWDNETTQTTCSLCPVGCSLLLDERDGEIMRTRSCENRAVNDIWLCDKGWFGYEFVEHEARLKKPLIRRNGILEEATWDEALSLVAEHLKRSKPRGAIAALGGNALTVEENYLFQKLFRDVLGVNNIDHRLGQTILPLESEGISAGMEISIGECEDLSLALFLGIDITEEFPVIWLRIKLALNSGGKGIFLGHFAPEIDIHLHEVHLHAPGQELETLQLYLDALRTHLKAAEGKKCAVFVGKQYLASNSRLQVLAVLLQLKQEFPHLSLNLLEGKGNSMGARFAGVHPELKAGGEQARSPGLNAREIIEKGCQAGWDLLYLAGSNPAALLPLTWKILRQNISFLVVQDLFLTESARDADVVLPALAIFEKEGSLINIEGRVQKVKAGKVLPDSIYADGQIFCSLAQKLGAFLELDAQFLFALEQEKIFLTRATSGMEVKNSTPPAKRHLQATFGSSLFDRGTRMQHNPHLLELVKEPTVRLNPADASELKIECGERIEVKKDHTVILSTAQVDPRVARGCAVLPLGFTEMPFEEMNIALINGFTIEIVSGGIR